MLEYAYTLYVQGMCDCGWPRHICQHPDNDGWFTAHKTVCNSRAAVDKITRVKGYEPALGEVIYTSYERPESKPLPPNMEVS